MKTLKDAAKEKTMEKVNLKDTAKVRAHLKPKYNQHIDEWLQLLAGGRETDLLKWISLITSQDKSCAALCLEGPSGTGKSLLAHGLANIWEGATQDFNADRTHVFLRNPLFIVNGPYGIRSANFLRNRVLTRKHKGSIKYQGVVRIDGYARVIWTLNEEVTADPEYVLHIPVSSKAKDYLDRLPGKTLACWGSFEIAEHALYLVETFNGLVDIFKAPCATSCADPQRSVCTVGSLTCRQERSAVTESEQSEANQLSYEEGLVIRAAIGNFDSSRITFQGNEAHIHIGVSKDFDLQRFLEQRDVFLRVAPTRFRYIFGFSGN